MKTNLQNSESYLKANDFCKQYNIDRNDFSLAYWTDPSTRIEVPLFDYYRDTYKLSNIGIAFLYILNPERYGKLLESFTGTEEQFDKAAERCRIILCRLVDDSFNEMNRLTEVYAKSDDNKTKQSALKYIKRYDRIFNLAMQYINANERNRKVFARINKMDN